VASTWFLLDIAYYSQNLFQSDIYTNINWVPKIHIYWKHTDTVLYPPLINYKSTCSTANWAITPSTTVSGTASCPETLHNYISECTVKDDGCWMTPTQEAFLVARAQAIISIASTVPGYWFTVFTVDRIGRWRIQVMGFFFMTMFMGLLAGR
jgi:hypothetical protein